MHQPVSIAKKAISQRLISLRHLATRNSIQNSSVLLHHRVRILAQAVHLHLHQKKNKIGKSQSYFLFISSIQRRKLLNSQHRMAVCFDYFQQEAPDDLRSGDRMEVHWC